MSSQSRKRAQRRADFARRAKYDPGDVCRVLGRRWGYITVHPMADEAALLDSLRLTPEDCWAVDCYWAVGDDVVFLQVATVKDSSAGAPGLWARRSNSRPNMIYVSAQIDRKYVARADVEGVMDRLSGLGAPHFKRWELGSKYQRLSRPPPPAPERTTRPDK